MSDSRTKGRTLPCASRRAVVALTLIAALAAAGVAKAEIPVLRTAVVKSVRSDDPLIFDGRIEAVRRAEVANRIDGVITAVHFTLGQTVEEGQLLVELAPESYEAAVLAARAGLDRARAELAQAQFVLGQKERLKGKGVASELQYQEAANAVAMAEAGVAQAEAELTVAELDLSRTRITAPIAGRIGEPLVALGAFVEAESGKPLARIVQLDPVRLVYDVPYDQRLRSISETGAETVEALLESVTVQLELPGGSLYPIRIQPTFSGAAIEPVEGTVRVSATVPNPDRLLLPGLPVRVLSEVKGGQRALSSIPREAVRTDQAGLHALVIQQSGLLERRPISILRADRDGLLVGGVFEGESVVVDAGPEITAGMMITPLVASEHQ